MSEETQTTTQYSLPPEYLQQFLAGGGAGTPGLFPLLNAAMANQFSTMGTPGATPYTYAGDRIAGFDPRELEAFKLADSAVGSYLPFLQRQEGLYEQGIGEAARGAQTARDYTQQGLDLGLAGGQEAMRRLRGLQATQDTGFQRAEDYMRKGAGEVLGGAGQAERASIDAYNRMGQQLGGARGVLGEAGRFARGATGEFDPSTGVSSYMNPYEDAVVQQTIKDMRDAGLEEGIGRRANEISQGAFGGSRAGLANVEARKDLGRGIMEAVSGIRGRGYEGARQAAMNEFARGKDAQARAASQMGQVAGGLGSLAGQEATSGQNLASMLGNLGQVRGGALSGMGQNIQGMTAGRTGLGQNIASGIGNMGGNLANLMQSGGAQLGNIGTGLGQFYSGMGGQFGQLGQNLGQLQRGDIGLLGNVGGANRGMQQAINDLAYQNFVGQYNLPAQLLGQYSQIAQGIAPMGGGTTTATSSQPGIDYFSSALGGLTNALGQMA
mgnify:FL=1|jgi:hypothetical protein